MLKISRNHRDISLLRSLWQKQMVRSGIIELPDWSNFLTKSKLEKNSLLISFKSTIFDQMHPINSDSALST